MLSNPKLYEINTRVWIKKFGKGISLSNIPESVFEDLADKGIDIVWTMGIWKTCTSLIESCCFSVDLVSSYARSLSDWKKEDVIGSPFSIDVYEVSPQFGNMEDLKNFREKLNKYGIKLFLDFVPNHFGAATRLLKTNPDVFLKGDAELLSKDPFTFFCTDSNSENIFAHGRDPLFPAWTDTVQVNYFCQTARDFMVDILLKLTELCDGVRCDMAMLQLNNVFQNTWLGVLNKKAFKKPKEEFWEYAIKKVKEKSPDFIFLAEAYWDLEWNLQQLGFDYTYDKRLTDRLGAGDVDSVKAHLRAEKEFQVKSTRFLENHDETRAVTKFGKKHTYAAAVLMSTLQGMKLYYDGQFEGKKIKLPVQLGREPEEKVSESLKEYYNTVLKITKSEIFKEGDWLMIDPLPISENNDTFEKIFAWQWKLGDELRIVVINYSSSTSLCRIRVEFKTAEKEIKLIDLLSNEEYTRSVNEIKNSGLFIELKSYHSHIFAIKDI
jgi:hypothetical protein